MRLPNPYAVPLVTIGTAGELLGMSRSSAYRATAAGEIPTVALAGTRWVPVASLYVILAIPLPPAPGTAPIVDHD